MEQKLRMFLTLCMAVLFSATAWAQERTITGRVTEGSGEGAIGVNVIVKGTTIGTATDFDGNYSLTVGEEAKILTYSGISYIAQDVEIGNQSKIDVTIASDVQQLSEVVITGMGVSRDKRAIGYAVTELKGESLSKVKQANIVGSLSGKISGVEIKSSATMGGGSNIVIRGQSSISGNNQALFVIDGVPISNRSSNSSDQMRGAGGYDYGNGASDINPDDIESVSVLKGAAASTLYGSRGANGVVLITTKKGTKKKGIGVSINSTVNMLTIDKSTLPNYQNEYGGGWGDTFPKFKYIEGVHPTDFARLDGVDMIDYTQDASWGPRMEGQEVAHWDTWIPGEGYLELRPYSATKHDVDEFFETGYQTINNIALSSANEKGSFRASITNFTQDDPMPNATLARTTINLSASMKLSEKLTASFATNYVNTQAEGRPGTGYDAAGARSLMSAYAMWHQRQLDVTRMKDYKDANGVQRAWNTHNPNDFSSDDPLASRRPIYWDNPYWTMHENYQNDERNRVFGNFNLNYKITDWISVTGRGTIDQYSQMEEERIAIGSAAEFLNRGIFPEYRKKSKTDSEINYDLFATVNKTFADKYSVSGILGTNYRSNKYTSTGFRTNGGLQIPDYYAIYNSKDPGVIVTDFVEENAIKSMYGSLSLGYNSMVFLDLQGRNDWSSTLSGANRSFFYPSVSTSFVFTELSALESSNIISFGKIRANWAQVGNSADPYSDYNYYSMLTPFGDATVLSHRNWSYDANLKNELTTEYELGLEMQFLNRRLGFDFAYYSKLHTDLLLPLSVSQATGFSRKYTNAAEMTNKGIELQINATPVIAGDFRWDMTVSWSQNRNEVTKLAAGVETHVINSNGVQVAAQVGQPFGTLIGTDFVYDENGNKLVDENGYYQKESGKVIGNVQADWNAGITNTLSYKGITISALIDIKKGGQLYSKTYQDGRATGVLAETVGNNHLGNPMRNPVTNDATSGGLLMDGVTQDGQPNTQMVAADYDLWNDNTPEADAIFDASYVKLREASISYSLPKSLLNKSFFTKATISFVGRNLFILQRNIDHIDPEISYGTGNMQGLDVGTLPTTRSYGVSVNLGF